MHSYRMSGQFLARTNKSVYMAASQGIFIRFDQGYSVFVIYRQLMFVKINIYIYREILVT